MPQQLIQEDISWCLERETRLNDSEREFNAREIQSELGVILPCPHPRPQNIHNDVLSIFNVRSHRHARFLESSYALTVVQNKGSV